MAEPVYDLNPGYITSQIIDYDTRLPGGYSSELSRFNLHGVNANFAVSSTTVVLHSAQDGAVDPPPFNIEARQDIPGCSFVEFTPPDGGGSDLCIDIIVVLKPTGLFSGTIRFG